MDLREQLESSLKESMRAGDDVRKRTLRMALSSIRLAEIDKGARLDDSGVMAILQKEIKSRHEAITDAERANRPDLIRESQAEIAVIENFLPKAMSPAELDELARQVIAEVGAVNIKEMGQVMKVLVPRLQGRASGDQASQAVRRLLQ
jgi:uncharacterized protein YqeY